jgi:two-component system, cell cycle sensor histidine kinase and response regulator CckA
MSPRHAKSLKSILVVDDDPSVVAVVHRILGVYGYQVLEAGTVEEAIAAVKQSPTGIDILIVDAVMPKVSGPELADILLFLRPDMKILFITGIDCLTIQLAFDRPCGFLQKPFSALALIAKVEDALGEAQSIPRDISSSG